jgi:hypothetical protein
VLQSGDTLQKETAHSYRHVVQEESAARKTSRVAAAKGMEAQEVTTHFLGYHYNKSTKNGYVMENCVWKHNNDGTPAAIR